MAMQQNGLAKLVEEAGEVIQVAGKLIQYPYHQTPGYPGLHPDGSHLRERLENELADLLAAAEFTMVKMQLDRKRIWNRTAEKVVQFVEWDRE